MKISKRRQVLALGGLAAFAAGYSETAGRMFGKLLGHDAPKHKTAGEAPAPEFRVDREGKLEINTAQQVSYTTCLGCTTMCGVRVRIDRASELLRTRVDLTLEAQNQDLLQSMNQRSQMQLQLQQAVEGLSVVAISYYAVSLATYALLPFAEALHLSKPALTAGLVPVVILAVWFVLRRIKKSMH